MQTVSLDLSSRALTYLLNSLYATRKTLMDQVGEEMGDEYEDLMMVNHLIKRLEEAHRTAEGTPAAGDAQG